MADYNLHIGIGVIDSQHQTFLTILQKIKECNYREHPEDLIMLVDELHLYTLYHFETEEKILEEHNVPNLEEHRKEHHALTERIEDYRMDCLSDVCLLADRMSEFLEEWLFEHIEKIDKQDFAIVKK